MRKALAALTLVLLAFSLQSARANFLPQSAAPDLSGILHYISSGWNLLTRSMADCKTFGDPKVLESSFLYLPYGFPPPPTLAAVEKGCALHLLRLPAPITSIGAVDISLIHPGGLLYLPNPYVVPGGMFNEMYGWDSYFIIRAQGEDFYYSGENLTLDPCP